MPFIHRNLTGSDAVHPAAFVAATDPGAVGADKQWIDTSVGPPHQLKVRNSTNTAWLNVGTLSSLPDPTSVRGDLLVRGPSTLDRLGIGALNTLFYSNGVDPSWTTAPSVSGEITALDFKANGVTGAANSVRLVGGNASGAPASGSFSARDLAIDTDGTLWVCTTGGSPGTWVQANTVYTTALQATALRASGLTGAANAVRIVGGNATGAPTTGTFQQRDMVIDSDGGVWVCISAGTPGTWQRVGGASAPLTAGLTSSDAFRRASIRGTGNKTTTSTTFVAISSVDLTPQSMLMNIGDMVACSLSGIHSNSGAGRTFFDFEVVAPAGTVRTGGSAVSGVGGNAATTVQPVAVEAVYEATAAGLHTFQPVWRVESGTATLYNDSGTAIDDVTILFKVEKVGTPPTLAVPSNLIYETKLTAAAATITIDNIPQQYRDLRMEVSEMRGTVAATSANLLMRFNGDATAIYDYAQTTGGSQVAQTSIFLTRIQGSTSPASTTNSGRTWINGYSLATYHKAVNSLYGIKLANTAGQSGTETGNGWWRSTAAITSITLLLSSGNFDTGTSVRIYGEPQANADRNVGTGTRLRMSGNLSVSNDTDAVVGWDTEDADADALHFTSSAALSGTVDKTTTTTLSGTSTAFLTELSIGQVISVPTAGGAPIEKRVVTSIASNTSLTVNAAFGNTSTGQTATRLNSPIVFRQPGFYNVDVGLYWASDADGYRRGEIVLNDTTVIGGDANNSIGAIAMPMTTSISQSFTQWDFVEVRVRHTAGAALDLTADQRTFFAVNARPTVIVAYPFVHVADIRASGTEGGTFTNGAWQTRTLNTTVTDTGGFSQLASNQLTLPMGTYYAEVSAPAFAVDRHVVRLQNITSATTLLESPVAFGSSAGSVQTEARANGRFRLLAASALEIQHRCATTTSTNGFGLAAGTSFTVDSEKFAQLRIWKEG